MMRLKELSLFASLVVAACSGQLDGRHHRATKSIIGIPIEITRQDLPVLTGDLFAECGVAIAPVAHRRIVVEHRGKQILETSTDPSGRFQVSGEMPSGEYIVRVDDPSLVGRTTIEVYAYEVDHARIIAKCVPEASPQTVSK
jgi:hypothetical protein